MSVSRTTIDAAAPTDGVSHSASLDDAPAALRGPRLAVAAVILVAAVGEGAWIAASGDPLAERRAQVAALDDAAKAALATKWERFQKLPAAEQQRLRDLHGTVEADADPESLRTALASYQHWVAELPLPTSAQLVGLPPAEKAAKIAEIAAEQSRLQAQQFSEADSKALMGGLSKLVGKHQDKLLADLPDSMRERLEKMEARERVWALMLFALSSRGNGPKLDNLKPDEILEIVRQLSPQAQAQAMAVIDKPDEFKQLLSSWIRQSMERIAASGQAGFLSAQVSEDELKRFFESDLSEDERTRMLALPRDEMAMQLRREYFRRKGMWRDGYWRDGHGPGHVGPQGFTGPGMGDGRDGRMGDGRGFGTPGGEGRGFGRPPGGFGPRPQGSNSPRMPGGNPPQPQGSRNPQPPPGNNLPPPENGPNPPPENGPNPPRPKPSGPRLN